MSVDNGDTIYYINTGSKKSHADVKKIRHYYAYDVLNQRIDVTKEVERDFKKWKKENPNTKININKWVSEKRREIIKEDEIVLNCMLVPRDIIDKEEDTFCSDVSEELEYNVEKYVDMFNKRITPLLVCFSRDIRSQILIDNPKDRPYFTAQECELVSGQPNKPGDQDTYEQLMTMEDKEFKFWTKYNLVPPFFEECGMGKWEDAVADYYDRMEKERQAGIAAIKEEYQKLIDALTIDEIDKFIDEGELPSGILRIVDVDPNTAYFIAKNFEDVKIGEIYDFIEKREELEYAHISEE